MLRTGTPYSPNHDAPADGDSSSSSHRARAAQGPTSLEGLTEAVAEQQGTDDAPPAAAHAEGEETAAETAKLRALEAAADAAAWSRLLGHCKIQLATGDLRRQLTGRRALAGSFHAATLGHMHAHLAGAAHGLGDVLAPGAPLLVETACNMVQLNKEQVAAFEARVSEMVCGEGGGGGSSCFSAVDSAGEGGWAPPGHLLFLRGA